MDGEDGGEGGGCLSIRCNISEFSCIIRNALSLCRLGARFGETFGGEEGWWLSANVRDVTPSGEPSSEEGEEPDFVFL